MLSKPKSVLLPLLLAFVVFGATAASRAAVKVGEPFPALSEFGLVGDVPVSLEGKVTLIDFWASWCAPCKASFPALDAIQRERGPQGLRVIGVSVDEKPSQYRSFLKKLAPSFLTLHDAEQRLVKAVVVPSMPTTYLLDRRGIVRYIHNGFHGANTVKALNEQLTSLLTEKL